MRARSARRSICWCSLMPGTRIDKVAGIEARGFIIAGAVAHQLSVGFVPVRKKGKLPWKTIGQTYDLEYGTDTVEIHEDAVQKGESVLARRRSDRDRRHGGGRDQADREGGRQRRRLQLHHRPAGTQGPQAAREAGQEGAVAGASSRAHLEALREAADGGHSRARATLPLGERKESAMKIHGRPYRTIWVADDGWSVEVIDQTKLPFAFATKRLATRRRGGRGDQVDGRARGAADRRDGGLRPLPGVARRCVGRGARAGVSTCC